LEVTKRENGEIVLKLNRLSAVLSLVGLFLCPVYAGQVNAEATAQSGNDAMNYDGGLMINGKTFVPLRQVSELLGADVNWVNETRTISIKLDNQSITLKIDSPEVTINGKSLTANSAPQIKENTTIVPLRLVSEALGANVQWDDTTKTAVVQRGEKTIDIASHPFFEIGSNHFVYDGEMRNGLPNGEGTGVRGISLYGEVLHQGLWVDGVPQFAASEEPSSDQPADHSVQPSTFQDPLYVSGDKFQSISESSMTIQQWYDESITNVKNQRSEIDANYQQAVSQYGDTDQVKGYFEQAYKGNGALEHSVNQIYQEAVASGNENSRFNAQVLAQRIREYTDKYLN
jgi:hypothetical protein